MHELIFTWKSKHLNLTLILICLAENNFDLLKLPETTLIKLSGLSGFIH